MDIAYVLEQTHRQYLSTFLTNLFYFYEGKPFYIFWMTERLGDSN